MSAALEDSSSNSGEGVKGPLTARCAAALRVSRCGDNHGVRSCKEVKTKFFVTLSSARVLGGTFSQRGEDVCDRINYWFYALDQNC